MRRYGFAWHPKWLVVHAVVLAVVTTMVLLGRWQLIVSDEKHFNLRNFGYALQWWAFSAFTLWMWWRILRDQAGEQDGGRERGAAPPGADREAQATPVAGADKEPEPVAYRRYVMPTVSSDPQADPELRAYNDYLARLAEKADRESHEQ